MSRRPRFANIRILPVKQRQVVERAFASMVSAAGSAGGTVATEGGEVFGLIERGRAVGGVWIRTWPGHPQVGDVHAAFSARRFGDYDSLVAFDMLLIERERVMGLKRWRALVGADNLPALRALRFLRFVAVSQQTFPLLGEAVILEREVM